MEKRVRKNCFLKICLLGISLFLIQMVSADIVYSPVDSVIIFGSFLILPIIVVIVIIVILFLILRRIRKASLKISKKIKK